MQDAHFSRSPTDQAHDASDVSEYVKVHTILVQGDARPLTRAGR